MFPVSDTLIEYYNLLHKKKKEGKHNLKVAAIFYCQAKEAIGFFEKDEFLEATEAKIKYGTSTNGQIGRLDEDGISNVEISEQAKKPILPGTPRRIYFVLQQRIRYQS